MTEPWETLLGHLRDNWMLRDHLGEATPPVEAIMADDRWWALSSGEQAMILVAGAVLRINECWLAVDEVNRARIDRALRMAIDV